MADEENMVQISREDLLTLQRGKAFLEKLWNGPKGHDFKKFIKTVEPTVNIPELDLIEQTTRPYDEKMTKLQEENKKLMERMDAKEKKEKEEREESDFTKTLADVRKEYGFTDEGMEKVKKRMIEKNNPDAESAAAWVAKQMPSAKPVTASSFSPQHLDLLGTGERKDSMMEEMHKNPMNGFDKETQNILDNPSEYREWGGNK